MNVDEVLTTAFDQLAPTNAPVMVIALRGWFDVASVATDALEELCSDRVAPIVASIDPDPFYDFTQERPEVYLDEDDERHLRWPENNFRLARYPGFAHDLVLLIGVEPHLRYATFADAIIAVAERLGCEVVVTLGAAAEAVPHTRVPLVVGSSTNDGLVSALGLSRPQYQGVTGLVGVLQERLDRRQIPAVSLRVGVPHYLGNAEHPRSSAALLQHLEHVLGVPTGHARLADDIARWRSLHDEAVAEDHQAGLYVTMLEAEYDRRREASLPSVDDLAADFERFLKEQRDE
jgi:PAC2 family